jgi:hypothetical protein
MAEISAMIAVYSVKTGGKAQKCDTISDTWLYLFN